MAVLGVAVLRSDICLSVGVCLVERGRVSSTERGRERKKEKEKRTGHETDKDENSVRKEEMHKRIEKGDGG